MTHGVKATFYVSIVNPCRNGFADWKAVVAKPATRSAITRCAMRARATSPGREKGAGGLHAGADGGGAGPGECRDREAAGRTSGDVRLSLRPEVRRPRRGREEATCRVVAPRFLAGRGWRDEGANDPAFCDLAQLMTIELDGLTWEQLKALIDQAAKNGSWLVLCGHDIGAAGARRRGSTLACLLRICPGPRERPVGRYGGQYRALRRGTEQTGAQMNQDRPATPAGRWEEEHDHTTIACPLHGVICVQSCPYAGVACPDGRFTSLPRCVTAHRGPHRRSAAPDDACREDRADQHAVRLRGPAWPDVAGKTEGCKKFTLGQSEPGVGPAGGFFTLANTILLEGPGQQAKFFNELQQWR